MDPSFVGLVVFVILAGIVLGLVKNS